MPPAARQGDLTAHGGTIAAGEPTVLIGGAPAARQGDMHVCPMTTGTVPHVGGPVAMGAPTVLINKLPAARMGDMCACCGPPDSIVMGEPTVQINAGGAANGGARAAMQTAAASEAVQPETTVLRENYLAARLTDASGRPIVSTWRHVTDADGAEDEGYVPGNGQVRRSGMDADGDSTVAPRAVFGAAWSTEEARVGDAVTITAKAVGFEDGTDVVVDIQRIDGASGGATSVDTVMTTVSGGAVEATWTFEHDEIDLYDPETPEAVPVPAGDAPRRAMPRFVADLLVVGAPTTVRTGPLTVLSTLTIGLDEGTDGVAGEPYVVRFSNGVVRRGRLDGNGRATLEDVPPCTHDVLYPRRTEAQRT